MVDVKPGDLFTLNGYDFRVHMVENGTAYGLKYRSEDRAVRNFADTDKFCKNLRLSIEDLLATGAEVSSCKTPPAVFSQKALCRQGITCGRKERCRIKICLPYGS